MRQRIGKREARRAGRIAFEIEFRFLGGGGHRNGERNGETVVISGLTKEKGTDINAGVPGLKDIPGGKYVFGHESKGKTMEEVLIFITPEILPTRELPPLPSAPSMSESPSLRNGALPAPSAGAARR